MRCSEYRLVATGWLLVLSALTSASAAPASAWLDKIRLPGGFRITVFSDRTPNVRSLAVGEDGTVYAGTTKAGKVYALRDEDGDAVAEEMRVIASGLNVPNGVAYRNGDLYVAEVQRVIKYPGISGRLDKPPAPTVVYDGFPGELHHGWKYLRFGPDGKLYVPVGAPCNICLSPNEIFATLTRMDPDGKNLEIVARGVRNTVGFDWHPETGKLFFNDNGRDELGDDRPPDELNVAPELGRHYGYPFCHGADIGDPEFGDDRPCSEFVAPVWKYAAHVAPLGMRFYSGKQFPEEYRNRLFVAEHGSWNRSKPQGYRVVVLQFRDGSPVAERSFAEGWLQPDGTVLGRPVDVLQLADGSLLVSDDQRGAIYRISYQD